MKKWYDMEIKDSKLMTKAKVECTFMIYDLNGPGPTAAQSMLNQAEPEETKSEDKARQEEQKRAN